MMSFGFSRVFGGGFGRTNDWHGSVLSAVIATSLCVCVCVCVCVSESD